MAMHALARLAIMSAALPVAATAQNYPIVGAPPIPGVATTVQSAMPAVPYRDVQARGDRGEYRRPVYGFRLPSQWAADQFFIADYRRYDLPRPAPGFG